MKTEALLVTSTNATGEYVSVEDWIDVTVQVVSSVNAEKFKGTISLEGTTDLDPRTQLWTPLIKTDKEIFLQLSGYSLAGLRAITTGFTAGEVTVVATAR